MATFLFAGCTRQESAKAANEAAPKSETETAPKPADGASPVTASQVSLSANAVRETGIQTAPVVEITASETVAVPGQLALNEDRTFHVGAFAAGRVVRVMANLGDAVKKDQVIAYLHSHEVHDGRADFQRAASQLAEARDARAFAERSRDRMQRLLNLKSVSLEQVDAAETSLLAAQQAVTRAETELARHEKHLREFLNVSVQDGGTKPGDTSDYIPVRAPAAGTVVNRKVGAGSVVATGEELFTISDLSTLWANISVNESDVSRARPGLAVAVTSKAYPDQVFRGTILKLGEQVDAATRTMTIRMLVPNPRLSLRPEMFVTADLTGSNRAAGLFIPSVALQEVNGQRIVMVEKKQGLYEARSVDLGANQGDLVAVKGGLRIGERVVTQGAFVLKSELLKRSLTEE